MTQEQADLARATGLLGSSFMPRTQDLAMATGMMGLGYMPQEQALGALGYGADIAKIADIGRRSGAEFYGQAGLGGIEALMQGMSEASAYDLTAKEGLLKDASGLIGGDSDDFNIMDFNSEDLKKLVKDKGKEYVLDLIFGGDDD